MDKPLDPKALDFPKKLIEKYSDEILTAIKNVSRKGKFNFKVDNGFTYLDASSDFAWLILDILRREGFVVRYQIRKNRTPGKIRK